ncbi:MAG TPA: hypothetical protein VFV32_12570 [Acidimicrobiales bacterium]|nr:hypothetical protein [Acidimicrobiales bacterium]
MADPISDPAAPLATPTPRPWRDRGPLVVLGCVLAYLPFTLLGYGTDIDVANVLRSGRTFLRDGTYEMSRPPGAVIHEIGTALLDRVGGSVLVNLGGVAFAALALWAVHELVRDDGARWPGWATVIVAANPWFWLAATSLGDFVWALGLAFAGALQARRGRRGLAGLLFGLSVGCRSSSALIVLAWLVAERTGSRLDRPSWRATATTAGVFLVLGVASFTPSFLSRGSSFEFLHHAEPFAGLGLSAGRWAVKNAAVIGVPAGVVFLLGIRRGFGALARWRGSVVVRFAVLTIVAFEVLFLRLPYKPVHLLPVVAAVALLIGASPAVKQRWLVALFAAQLVGGLVGSTIGEPDVPHRATSGRLVMHLTEGALLNDVRCRLDDRDDGPWPDVEDPGQLRAAMTRAAILFDCQSQTWKVTP